VADVVPATRDDTVPPYVVPQARLVEEVRVAAHIASRTGGVDAAGGWAALGVDDEVVRAAEQVVIDALFVDITRAVVTTVATTAARPRSASNADSRIVGHRSRASGDDRTTLRPWARSPP
jgi:hypothetical protein